MYCVSVELLRVGALLYDDCFVGMCRSVRVWCAARAAVILFYGHFDGIWYQQYSQLGEKDDFISMENTVKRYVSECNFELMDRFEGVENIAIKQGTGPEV